VPLFRCRFVCPLGEGEVSTMKCDGLCWDGCLVKVEEGLMWKGRGMGNEVGKEVRTCSVT
jgi:hypothetical protein